MASKWSTQIKLVKLQSQGSLCYPPAVDGKLDLNTFTTIIYKALWREEALINFTYLGTVVHTSQIFQLPIIALF